jgi:hypothetical protein
MTPPIIKAAMTAMSGKVSSRSSVFILILKFYWSEEESLLPN